MYKMVGLHGPFDFLSDRLASFCPDGGAREVSHLLLFVTVLTE